MGKKVLHLTDEEYQLDATIMFYYHNYVGHLESKERLRIQPAQLFHFS